MSGRLRIAINAGIKPGSGTGGIETVLRGLATLGHLDDGDEEYVFIAPWDDPDWLRPLLGARSSIVPAPRPVIAPASRSRAKPVEAVRRIVRPVRAAAGQLKRALSASAAMNAGAPVSDGFYESLRCDVIHFPFQTYVRCALPSVYNPHDLQHRHFPQFFTKAEIRRRELLYAAACRTARTVVVASQFVKRDVAASYRLAPGKIPLDVRAVLSKYGAADVLPAPDAAYALYPAMTWEHKNHLRLLEALALLRDRDGLRVRLICTGQQNDFWPLIRERLAALRLEAQVTFTGIVSPQELNALYDAAQFVVIPTLFEAASAPLFEAWQHDAPVACASVTSLPEQAADAALLFDPLSVESIAAAVARMTREPDLRAELRRRGHRRLSDFSWARTLRAYRAVYRRAAGRALNDEDTRLLRWDWNVGGSDSSLT